MPHSKSRKVTRNKEEKIQLIYKVFFDLVREHGYSNVSTNHVAAAANLSIGTIYRYFPRGKISIITQYFDTVQEDIFNFERFPFGNPENMEDGFRAFTAQFVRNHRQNSLYNQAYEQAMIDNPEVLESYTQKVDAFLSEIAQNFHQSSSELKKVPIERVKAKLWVIFSVFQALTRQHLVIMPLFPTDEEFVDFLTKLLSYFTRDTSE
jgi:AcrR family transcriptional regulator